jgi:hypothetical protein
MYAFFWGIYPFKSALLRVENTIKLCINNGKTLSKSPFLRGI